MVILFKLEFKIDERLLRMEIMFLQKHKINPNEYFDAIQKNKNNQ